MIKIIKESMLNEDENTLGKEDLKELNEAAIKFADHVEKAFVDFKGKFDSKPGEIREYIDKNGFFIENINYELYICDLIFMFQVRFTDSFNKGRINVRSEFTHYGNVNEHMEFTSKHAEELLRATKIAESLKEEVETELTKYNN